MAEARLVQTENGRLPEGDGWFVLNAREAPWVHSDRLGSAGFWEGAFRWPEVGVTLGVLQPGQSGGLYHAEKNQEGFLVLAGEGLAVVEGRERPLRQWDYFHSPAGRPHVLVGMGSAPFVYFAVGARHEGASIVYPVDETALRHGAGVEQEATSGKEAYAGGGWQPGPFREGGLPDFDDRAAPERDLAR
ncbi:MAG TPA: cupin domain-containing protein [Gaiellaceae bacterium]|nr:cupin domain-containing protein [Gaiellaceae bacterium]